MAYGKNILRNWFRALGFDVRQTFNRRVRERRAFSRSDEREIIDRYLGQMDVAHRFCVDIGAGDGVRRSNILALVMNGWSGLALEYDPEAFSGLAYLYGGFPKVQLCRSRVTPENVVALLESAGTPKEFGFLSLDINGYDHFVLDAILEAYRPSLMCVEINEKIPPPVKFTVKYSPDYAWNRDAFMGQSLSQLCQLTGRRGYALAELHYANAFLMPEEICPVPAQTPEEAYRKGYVDRPDRREKFPWNNPYEELLHLPPEQALEYVNRMFAKYEGKYICTADQS